MHPFALRCKQHALKSWEASFGHPFVKALIDGSLSSERFRFYQMQDARYLEGYADVCSVLSTKYRRPEDKLWFIEGAKLALVVEQQLHTEYGKQLGYSAQDVARLELTPNNRAYLNHMMACASHGPLLKGLAALAPCPWLYSEIGIRISEQPGGIRADHPHRDWLLTYADPSFLSYTNELLLFLERESQEKSSEDHYIAMEAFDLSVKYEWMFWDQAWNMQSWPV